jgi:chromosome segregation ATPase
MIEGTSVEDYKTRMSEINQYVKNTERKITALEKSMMESRSAGKQYASSLKKLKSELEERNQELATLQEKVSQFQNENSNLIQTVTLQKAEIEDKLAQIEAKTKESQKLQGEVQQLMVQSKIDESEAYYVKGTLLEETARRTKFAPRKKKETTLKAIDMYELSALYGNEKAAAKAAELKKRI